MTFAAPPLVSLKPEKLQKKSFLASVNNWYSVVVHAGELKQKSKMNASNCACRAGVDMILKKEN